jgi:hypothetical protein
MPRVSSYVLRVCRVASRFPRCTTQLPVRRLVVWRLFYWWVGALGWLRAPFPPLPVRPSFARALVHSYAVFLPFLPAALHPSPQAPHELSRKPLFPPQPSLLSLHVNYLTGDIEAAMAERAAGRSLWRLASPYRVRHPLPRRERQAWWLAAAAAGGQRQRQRRRRGGEG